MTPLPAWLVAHLTDTGHANPDGAARAARYRRCPSCRHLTLTGLDADRAALAITCEPTEIDTNGELLALALGLRTYTLTRAITSTGKTAWNIDPRHRWAIQGGHRKPIIAEHRCGISIPGTSAPLLTKPADTTNCETAPF